MNTQTEEQYYFATYMRTGSQLAKKRLMYRIARAVLTIRNIEEGLRERRIPYTQARVATLEECAHAICLGRMAGIPRPSIQKAEKFYRAHQ